MPADQIKHPGLTNYFEALLSMEGLGKYKPHGADYRFAASRVWAGVSLATLTELICKLEER
jgi:hypothetical protein